MTKFEIFDDNSKILILNVEAIALVTATISVVKINYPGIAL